MSGLSSLLEPAPGPRRWGAPGAPWIARGCGAMGVAPSASAVVESMQAHHAVPRRSVSDPGAASFCASAFSTMPRSTIWLRSASSSKPPQLG